MAFDVTPYQACFEDVHPSTLQRIIEVESGGNPIALNINGAVLPRKPKSKEEAIDIAQQYIDKGYSVDVGFMQINSKNFARYGVTLSSVLDPCTNIKTGSRILHDAYQRAYQQEGNAQSALLVALSIYNTGNTQRGFKNGYVGKYTGKYTFSTSPTNFAITTIDIDGLYD
jgi:type IV secretion system protein VirB1